MDKKLRKKGKIILSTLLVFTTSFIIAQTNRYWSGNGPNDDFGQPLNWYSGNPNSGDNIYFNNTQGRHNAYSNYGTGSFFNEIITYSGANGIRIYGDNLYANKFENFDDSNLLELSPSSAAVGSREIGNRLNSDFEINPVGSGGILINCDKVSIDNTNGSRTLRVYGFNTLTINAAIYENNGSGAKLQVFQNPIVILNGQNLYTGLTTITSGTLRLNHIGGNTLPISNSITVESSGVLRISTNQTLNTLNLNSGNIIVDSGVVLTVDNLIVNGGQITGNGKLIVKQNLSINSGTLTTNDNLILASTSSNTAQVTPVSGNVLGKVTVERYIPAKRAWRLLTAPLKGTTNNTIADNWQGTTNEGLLLFSPATFQNQAMTGYATGGNAPNIYQYGTGWQIIPDLNSEAIFGANATDTKAYQVFVTGGHGSSNIVSGEQATTLRSTGELITGSVTHPLTANTYKLIANPYASPLNTEALVQANSGSKAWLLDPSVGFGAYVTYDGANWSITPSGNDANIQSGQGFLVRSTGTSFEIQESHKTTGNSNTWFEKNASSTADKIRVLLYKAINNEWQLADGILAVNSADGNTAVDNTDAGKISNFNESMMFRNGTSNLSIEYRALPQVNEVQPIRLTGTAVASYELRLFTENYNNSSLVPMLEDTQTGTFTTIPTDGSIVSVPFTGVVATGTNPDNRFRIVYQAALSNDVFNALNVSVYPNPVNEGFLNINLLEAGKATYNLYNLVGQEVLTGTLMTQNSQLTLSSLQTGVYILSIEQAGKKHTTKVVVE